MSGFTFSLSAAALLESVLLLTLRTHGGGCEPSNPIAWIGFIGHLPSLVIFGGLEAWPAVFLFQTLIFAVVLWVGLALFRLVKEKAKRHRVG